MPGGGSETGGVWWWTALTHTPADPEDPGSEPWKMPEFSHFQARALSPMKVPQETQ